MSVNSPIALTLFDFCEEFAGEVRAGKPQPSMAVTEDARIVVFCASFFDQLFAHVLERPIEGFTPESKRAAARLAEELKKDPGQPDELRSLIPLFEKFCDMYSELIGGSYGAGEITYKQFHEKYVSRLLARAQAWAEKAKYLDLGARIHAALEAYEGAIRTMKW
jgi:hypothetical protein